MKNLPRAQEMSSSTSLGLFFRVVGLFSRRGSFFRRYFICRIYNRKNTTVISQKKQKKQNKKAHLCPKRRWRRLRLFLSSL
jgi:hypothetical protein